MWIISELALWDSSPADAIVRAEVYPTGRRPDALAGSRLRGLLELQAGLAVLCKLRRARSDAPHLIIIIPTALLNVVIHSGALTVSAVQPLVAARRRRR